MSPYSIDILRIPRCITSVGTKSLQEELLALDAIADGGQSDGYLTVENFNFLKRRVEELRRFASFGDFRRFIQQQIASQLCTEACLEESKSQRSEGGCLAPPPPMLPPEPVRVVEKQRRPVAPRTKPKVAAEQTPPPAPPKPPSRRLWMRMDELPPKERRAHDAQIDPEGRQRPPSRKLPLMIDELSPEQLAALVVLLYPFPAKSAPPTKSAEERLNALLKHGAEPTLKPTPKLAVARMRHGNLSLPRGMELLGQMPDGSVVVRNDFGLGSFEAKIMPDGSVEMNDRIPLRHLRRTDSGFETYFIDDLISPDRKRYADTAKRQFLEATREERDQMYAAATKEALSASLRWLPSHLQQIVHSKRRWEEKRQILFDLWDECEDETRIRPESSEIEKLRAATGVAAQRVIAEFIQRHLAEGSPQAYSAEELAALNAQRKREGAPLFEPYKMWGPRAQGDAFARVRGAAPRIDQVLAQAAKALADKAKAGQRREAGLALERMASIVQASEDWHERGRTLRVATALMASAVADPQDAAASGERLVSAAFTGQSSYTRAHLVRDVAGALSSAFAKGSVQKTHAAALFARLFAITEEIAFGDAREFAQGELSTMLSPDPKKSPRFQAEGVFAYEAAIEAAKRAKNARVRAGILKNVAAAMSDANAGGKMVPLYEKMIAAAVTIGDRDKQEATLRAIASSLNGPNVAPLFERLISQLQSLKDDGRDLREKRRQDATVLRDMALLMRKAGLEAEGLTAVRRAIAVLQEDSEGYDLLREMGEGYAKAGFTAAARLAFGPAMDAAGNLKRPVERGRALRLLVGGIQRTAALDADFAKSRLILNLYQRARRLALVTGDPRESASTLCTVAEALADSIFHQQSLPAFEESITKAKGILDAEARTGLQTRIAAGLISMGQKEMVAEICQKALTSALAIGNPAARSKHMDAILEVVDTANVRDMVKIPWDAMQHDVVRFDRRFYRQDFWQR